VEEEEVVCDRPNPPGALEGEKTMTRDEMGGAASRAT
jgi:hypothetical protein